METHFTYLAILAASLFAPLALSFDRKVAFYKKWKYLFKAMILPAVFYIVWDIYFTSLGVWSFNEEYITGIKIINLPVEEVLFFFVVPYCCLFIYECLCVYFRTLKKRPLYDSILKVIAILLLVTGLLSYTKLYTSWTFILLAAFTGLIYARRKFFRHFDATAFIIAWSIILIPFLIVNGYLTSIPVVRYNNAENLGFRISTIPFEDVFYGMLLFMMNVAGYERLKSGRRTKHHPVHKLHHHQKVTG